MARGEYRRWWASAERPPICATRILHRTTERGSKEAYNQSLQSAIVRLTCHRLEEVDKTNHPQGYVYPDPRILAPLVEIILTPRLWLDTSLYFDTFSLTESPTQRVVCPQPKVRSAYSRPLEHYHIFTFRFPDTWSFTVGVSEA